VTTFDVRIDPAAQDDIANAFLWYQERRASVAEDFRREVIDAIERVARAPLMRKADARGDRKIGLHRFPYAVWYFVEGNTVIVVAVGHHRRRPAYWRQRV
jgi:plasmid stabilization system protein ParE